MKLLYFIFFITFTMKVTSQTLPLEEFSKYPQTEIKNKHVTMKLFLPNSSKGFYRATRFDWSGIISSLRYKNHEYFGYWKSTHDPLVHEDLTGPVESFQAPGLGYKNDMANNRFIRIGIGVLEMQGSDPYVWNKTYKIIDNGTWDIDQGKDWIEFRHRIDSYHGFGYEYIKRIELKANEAGFTMSHTLKNTGTEIIETDQYNHNFFIIDGERSGPAINISFPYKISTDADLGDVMEIDGKELKFIKDLKTGESIWMELMGYRDNINDHQVVVKNVKSGAGVKFMVDKPLSKMVFWACHTTYCPENFLVLKIEPGDSETWVSDYTLFIE